MSVSTRPATDVLADAPTTLDQLVELGWSLNTSQRQMVLLAARYEEELEWFTLGLPNAASGIARRLQIHTATVREWIRIGHALADLPLIDHAFATNEISFAKVKILTRRAEPHNEAELLELARTRSANRLTTAIARLLANDEDDAERDRRLHDARSLTHHIDGDGLMVIRLVVAPSVGKPIVAAMDEMVNEIARTPADDASDPPADGFDPLSVVDQPDPTTHRGEDPSAGGSPAQREIALRESLREIRRRWTPQDDDGLFPTLAQQRADAFLVLFVELDVAVQTEIVIHVRGDGSTFDDGSPITNNAIARQLDEAFIRLLIHDAERRPIDASSRRRHPTTRQKRVVMERHNHECVDCQATDLIELDHNPPYAQTLRTVIEELEPRCAPCHRARHRLAA